MVPGPCSQPGFTEPAPLDAAGALLPHPCTLACAPGKPGPSAVCFCGTVLTVARTGRYPASLAIGEPGLSSERRSPEPSSAIPPAITSPAFLFNLGQGAQGVSEPSRGTGTQRSRHGLPRARGRTTPLPSQPPLQRAHCFTASWVAVSGSDPAAMVREPSDPGEEASGCPPACPRPTSAARAATAMASSVVKVAVRGCSSAG